MDPLTIIHDYHDLCTGRLAEDSWAQLQAQIRVRHLTFGGRPICTVLRPYFITPEGYGHVRREAGLVAGAMARVFEVMMAEPRLRAQMDLSPEEDYLLRLDPGFPSPDGLSRLDAFFNPVRAQLRFVEYNAESPGGLGFGDALAEVFLDLPIMRLFRRHYDVRALPVSARVLDMLLRVWRVWGGQGLPRIAIVDWRDVPTYNEFLLFQESFGRAGVPAVIADPDELELRHGRLWAAGAPVDLVYRRVVTSELIARGGLNHPLIRAVAERVACVINSFRMKLLLKKSIIAVLSDEANRGWFTAEQQAAIARCIPWTRRLREGYTTHNSQRIDLLPFVLAERERLVLKPNDDYGGRGVIVGWETEPSVWEQAVMAALSTSAVVQERVDVPSEDYPAFIDGRMDISKRLLDLDPYLYGGELVEGCGVRLGTSAILNVSAGGGSAVPMLITSPLV